jgi:hypothetical protein
MEKMKLFKKALVATAILGAFGAQAADVSDATKKTSTQGYEVNGAADSSVRVIVREKLEAGDKVHLTFGAGLDLDQTGNNATVAFATGTGGNPTDYQILVESGTSDVKMALVVAESDLSKNLIVLEVQTGFTIDLDESFEVNVGLGLFTTKATTANSTVQYDAFRWQDGAKKDTSGDNIGSLIVFADQYAVSVKTPFNGVVARENSNSDFISGASTKNGAGVDFTGKRADSAVIVVNDNQSLLSAVTSGGVITHKIEGDFTDYAADQLIVTGTADTYKVGTIDKTGIVITQTDAGAAGFDASFTVDIDHDDEDGGPAVVVEEITIGSFTLDSDIDFGGANDYVAADNADIGAWTLDATIINIPYFPVGYEGLSTSVHFANESSAAVDVIITAIDNKGVTYSVANQVDMLAAKTVTKVSQTTLQSLLKDKDGNTVPNGTKLSVTFNIDADNGDVNAYAMSNEMGVARQQLANSQQKGLK